MKQQTVKRTVLITGAAGSLGTALSIEFARTGFNTVMLDSNQKILEKNWDLIVQDGLPEPSLHPLDLASANLEQFVEMGEALRSEFGVLDGLIHCAAKFGGLMPLEQVPPHEWLQQMQVNLNSAWLLSVTCLPLLRLAESSFLYFLLEDMRKMEKAYWGSYGVSKHALKALVNQFASESESTNVQVLGINPGPMASRLRAEAYHAENPANVPSATVAAQKILRLATGEIRPAQTIMNLN